VGELNLEEWESSIWSSGRAQSGRVGELNLEEWESLIGSEEGQKQLGWGCWHFHGSDICKTVIILPPIHKQITDSEWTQHRGLLEKKIKCHKPSTGTWLQ
jgi:hypothetical protein